MIIALLTASIRLPWSHSLKEKRMEVNSLKQRLSNTFNVSVIESDTQDVLDIATLSVCSLTANQAQADSTLDHILAFIEGHTQGEVTTVHKEFL